MKKINISRIIKFIVSIIANACILFTLLICAISLMGYMFFRLTTIETPNIFVTLAYAAVIAASHKIFAVKVIPVISRHIIFFAAIYASFIFIYMPVVNRAMSSKSTFYLSVIFIVLYLIGAGLVQLAKYIISRFKNKKEEYNDQFSQLKKK